LIEENPSSNFFIDEAPVSEDNFQVETLLEISKEVSRNNYLWIACQSDKVPHRKDPNLAGNNFRFKEIDCKTGVFRVHG
jgi:hypothetical protein